MHVPFQWVTFNVTDELGIQSFSINIAEILLGKTSLAPEGLWRANVFEYINFYICWIKIQSK